MDPSNVLAGLAVPVFITAIIVNVNTFIRHYRTHRGPALIMLLMAFLSAGYAGAYGLTVARVLPDLDPPVNVLLIRPLVLFTGLLFSIVPGWLISVQEANREHADVELCRKRLLKAEHELGTAQQTIEMLMAANAAFEAETPAEREARQARKAARLRGANTDNT
jgi:hypothetical protein